MLTATTTTISNSGLVSLIASSIAFAIGILGIYIAVKRDRPSEIAIIVMMTAIVGISLLIRYAKLFGWFEL